MNIMKKRVKKSKNNSKTLLVLFVVLIALSLVVDLLSLNVLYAGVCRNSILAYTPSFPIFNVLIIPITSINDMTDDFST